MPSTRNRSLVLLAAIALGAATAHAQWATWESDLDDERKEWKELEAKIPAYPKDGNLIPFEAGAASPHRFFIDAPSLSIGEDNVVRYILVIRTAGGATNVTFEGIRCDTREQKYYAMGHPDGTWTRARNPQWRRIEYRDINRQHSVLFGDYLCRGNSLARTPVESVKLMLQRLKYGPQQRIVE